jgi:two-component system, OmpR family, sensor histidine kinase BaeS
LLSLRWKLGGALLLVVLVSVGIMAYLTNQNTTSQFQQYVQAGGMMYTQRIANTLQQYYSQQKSWNGVQDVLIASLRSSGDRLVLTDNSGRVVGDTAGEGLGKSAPELNLTNGIPISVSGQNAGTLYTFSSSQGPGRGYMGGLGMMGSQGAPTQTAEQDFLTRTNSYLWIAGLIAILVALLLGVLLTRQITRPIRELTSGAQHISGGDLGYRVKITSNDELGNLARSFNSMAASLDNSEQSRKRLVSDVAHELRTPLTIIEGTVDGIMDGVFQSDKERLETIKEQTSFLTALVNDLRELSLADAGQLKLDRQPTNMVELISRKLSQFEAAAIEKKITIRMENAPNIPEIGVDSRRIEQVITNLLSNSIRHTPLGGVVTVSLKTTETSQPPSKRSLVISVKDTGEGIAAENLPHLFERFYRVESSRARSEGGAGLGLAIVRQLVEAHGGQVKVESQVGKGSTFYVLLPVASESSSD